MSIHDDCADARGCATGTVTGFVMPRLLKWVGIAIAVLLLIIAMLLFWLLATASGTRFALARAVAATDGKLVIERSSGTLAGSLTLEGLRWHDPANGVDVKIGHVRVDLATQDLLAKRLHVTALDVNDVDIALTTLPPNAGQPASQFSLIAPLDIVLDQVALRRANIRRDGHPLFALDSLDLSGAWTRYGVAVKSLKVRAPDGNVDLHGTVSALAGYPGNGETSFRWKVADVEYAGTLKASGDGRQAQLDFALTEPTPANVIATLTQSRDLPWTAKITVPRFDPKRVHKDASLTALALNLEGSGNRQQGTLSGEVVVNDHRAEISPLRYALAGQTLQIEALTLKSPEASGTLHASGVVQLDAKPVSATLALDWQGVHLPADLVGQNLATHGKVDVSGSAEKFHAAGALSIGPPGKLSDIALDLDGTPDAITLRRLELKQAEGGLDAQGVLKLKPALGWQLTAKADRLDPGAFAAAWPGALDFDVASEGTLTDRGPDATIKLTRLGGTLRKRSLSGNADLVIKPGYIIDGKLALASGKSRVEVSGRGGEQTDATVKLAIVSLGDWLPHASGDLDGEFHLRGKWPKLAVKGTARGAKIVYSAIQVGTLDLSADLANIQPAQGRFSLKATQASSGSLAFDTLSVAGSGNLQAHRFEIDATGNPLGLKLTLDGSTRNDGRWSGTLKTLDVAIKGAPPLALQQTAQLGWDGKQFSASEICLVGGGAKLCAAGHGGGDGALAARYRIEQLPLALIAKLASPEVPLNADGLIAGTGDIRRDAKGALTGTATLHSAKGTVTYTANAGQPLLSYSGLALDATLSPQSTHATLRAALDHDGKLDGDVTLSGAPGSVQALSGHVDATLNSLVFVELLTPEVADIKGRLVANYTIGGTTAAPQLNGALALKDFATEVPSAGLKLHDGDINVRATDAAHFTLDGTVKSGDGTLTLSGSGGVGANAPFKASIKGDNFLAADIPAARVVISPDLSIERSAENITVGGSVTIPKAKVDLEKLPGGGIAQTSPDVVVTDAEQPAPGKPLPVIVAVDVKLGHDVKLAGMGLDGSISGQLRIDQRPGRVATGTGTLNVGGTYKAYGQNLQIESGRLLFAGTALDNPGLDIRAVRKILGASGGLGDDTITAGLQVRGTALVPVLTVFSNPALEQSEALSYLVTGKPLSGLKSGEGDMLGTAARALGSATGDLLAKGIGARTGLDTRVADSSALGGAAFTVGKYLSPKLYLSYGVGLFTPGEVVTLKYLFNRRWNFEAENATTGNRAGINYRWEH